MDNNILAMAMTVDDRAQLSFFHWFINFFGLIHKFLKYVFKIFIFKNVRSNS